MKMHELINGNIWIWSQFITLEFLNEHHKVLKSIESPYSKLWKTNIKKQSLFMAKNSMWYTKKLNTIQKENRNFSKYGMKKGITCETSAFATRS